MKKLLLILSLISFNSFSQNELELKVFDLVNQYRLENKLQPVVWDSLAYNIAKSHCDYMCTSGEVTHIDIKDFKYRFSDNGVKRGATGYENCAMVVNTKKMSLDSLALRLLNCWKNSPSHNDILLKPEMKYVGIANDYGFEYNEMLGFNELGDVIVRSFTNEIFEWFSLDGYDKK